MASDRGTVHLDARAALDALVALVESREPRCAAIHLVAIDGPSGAGKTTLAAEAAALLAAPTVHLDDLYPGWDGLRAATERVQQWVVEPLRAGRPARYRRWDWLRGADADWVELPAAPVVLLEGCGSGALPAGAALSALVWVEAEEQVRYARAINRDPGFAEFWSRWAAQEDELFSADRTRDRADLAIDTTDQPL
ncbi:hypothetical protein [Pedococcus sp. 5OH_020]|uniref:hypothetical protein n=1 Tax=Pedococcus sp. 5OH_020 TaxID=2989814 RepID=UPI0022E9ECAA|nr:hypothetical protein [Pedococcus sp. 5OH_020]